MCTQRDVLHLPCPPPSRAQATFPSTTAGTALQQRPCVGSVDTQAFTLVQVAGSGTPWFQLRTSGGACWGE